MSPSGPVPASRLLDHLEPGTQVIAPIFVGCPESLLDALEEGNEQLTGVRVHGMGEYDERAYIRGEFGDRLRHVGYYLGPGTRGAFARGECDLVPNHFSEMPLLLRALDGPKVVIAAASPPDRHGYFSLGTNADYCAALIGEVPFFLEANRQMPRSHGENQIHISQVLGWTEVDRPLYEQPPSAGTDPRDRAIAEFIVDRVPDGACMQFGIGSVPDTIAGLLQGHRRDLGIHTEVLTDGIMRLVESGTATGARKTHHRGLAVATFALGSRALYDWIDDNPGVALIPVDQTNDPRRVGAEPLMVSVNATTEVDLMGQAASETIAGRYYSSSGGQVDFARGVLYSEGGQGFLVTRATTSKGLSKISARLSPGSVVTTHKNTVDHVVTEYGVARLRGRSLRQRASALIGIAAPEHRDDLTRQAHELGLL
ncbi:propionyl-CoA--succinate CoA transferase [Gordonia desulfuricans]|uniref:Propionyl-CoA--succinate CoA transferase n=1 Tax=Gordonia desulfuricans TaxID=89051 RepID=A0A7K3LJZ8_9ACTN|nr:acetyl-CoA hydrolase/transferase C-terminal domain-containing protein [Gordonia desulfuricans]NDK88566.1 propionyl-CoA--succinate CoA transferase [Gordonia desulfuricans]